MRNRSNSEADIRKKIETGISTNDLPKKEAAAAGKKVLVGMSGGVDSSVAAFLLKEEGYEVTGCTMRLYDYTGIGLPESNTCCSLKDVSDARSVCERLGIPFLALNFMADFRREVMDRFVREYLEGRTPNPCIDCNRRMKFDRMWKRARELGFDYIATGHYVQKVYRDGRWYLKKAVDETRDQSYVLYPMKQELLSHVLFPLGGLRKKTEVRKIAEEQGFVNAHKHDSEDICFVPDKDYAGLIERLTGKKQKPGDLITREGRVLGKHKGAIRYTIGQRRGLGLSVPEPVYVLSKDMKKNTVTVGREGELMASQLQADDWFWMRKEPAAGESFRASAKIRYRKKEEPARVTVMEKDMCRIDFDEKQRAISPGQAVVLYDGDLVIGGGTIL